MQLVDLMHKDVKTTDVNETIGAATEKMRMWKVNSLVVTIKSDVVGIITGEDLAVKCLGEDHRPWDCQVFRHISMPVVTAPSDMDLRVAMSLMLGKGINHLPVMDGPELVGVISLSDIARRLIELDDQLVASQPSRESI